MKKGKERLVDERYLVVVVFVTKVRERKGAFEAWQ